MNLNTSPEGKGFLTSEFVTMIIGQVVGVLAMFGKIAPDETGFWGEVATLIVGGLLSVGTGIFYIIGRTKVKQALILKDKPILE